MSLLGNVVRGTVPRSRSIAVVAFPRAVYERFQDPASGDNQHAEDNRGEKVDQHAVTIIFFAFGSTFVPFETLDR
jgi:hypothetical protein